MVGKNPELSSSVPAALPDWITPELVKDTIETWQPYYAQPLTESEAVEILRGVGRLLDLDPGGSP